MDARQLKKGVLDILLLKLLKERTYYGYELMSELDGRSGGYFAAKEGTLYPVLYRLEDAGLIKSLWEKTDSRRGAPRKYYSITQSGSERLDEARAEFSRFVESARRIMED